MQDRFRFGWGLKQLIKYHSSSAYGSKSLTAVYVIQSNNNNCSSMKACDGETTEDVK